MRQRAHTLNIWDRKKSRREGLQIKNILITKQQSDKLIGDQSILLSLHLHSTVLFWSVAYTVMEIQYLWIHIIGKPTVNTLSEDLEGGACLTSGSNTCQRVGAMIKEIQIQLYCQPMKIIGQIWAAIHTYRVVAMRRKWR